MPRLTLLVFTLLCCIPQIARAQLMTGINVITNLNQLAFLYEDLTNLANSLPPFPGSQVAQTLIKEYSNVTQTELTEGTAPQPTVDFSEAQQFAVLAGQQTLILENRRFLTALTLPSRRFSFNHHQRGRLRKIIVDQLVIVGNFDRDDDGFAPGSEPASLTGSRVLNASLTEAAKFFD